MEVKVQDYFFVHVIPNLAKCKFAMVCLTHSVHTIRQFIKIFIQDKSSELDFGTKEQQQTNNILNLLFNP